MKKLLAVGIILLLVGMSIPSTGRVMEQPSTVSSYGNTLYVGGSGPGNYTNIQDAIDNASDGDMVFVYDDSSPYIENLFINKSISLMGEDRDTTIINGFDMKDVVRINNTENVNIWGFTIRNSPDWWIAGVKIESSNDCNISGNNFIDNIFAGVYIPFIPSGCRNISIIGNNITQGEVTGINIDCYAVNCIIKNNIISDFKEYYSVGISVWGENNRIIGNTIVNNFQGIYLSSGRDNLVSRNKISDNMIGIEVMEVDQSNFTYNIIANSELGITLKDSLKNIIKHNNFINNHISNSQEIYGRKQIINHRSNRWIGNYYSGWIGIIPKPIFVVLWTSGVDIWGTIYEIPIPWFPMFDCFPAIKPYDIEV